MSQEGRDRLAQQRLEDTDRFYMQEYEESKNVSDFVKHGAKLGKGGKEATKFGRLKSKQLGYRSSDEDKPTIED